MGGHERLGQSCPPGLSDLDADALLLIAIAALGLRPPVQDYIREVLHPPFQPRLPFSGQSYPLLLPRPRPLTRRSLQLGVGRLIAPYGVAFLAGGAGVVVTDQAPTSFAPPLSTNAAARP